MNALVCVFAALVVYTVPGDFAANRLFLLLLLFSLLLLHHYMKGRPSYYRTTEYLLLGAVFVVWAAAFVTPHYFLLQPLINLALTLHAGSAIVFYWPTEEDKKKEAFKILYRALPWLFVAGLAQWKSADWIPQVTVQEKFLPKMQVSASATATPGDTTMQAIDLFNLLKKRP